MISLFSQKNRSPLGFNITPWVWNGQGAVPKQVIRFLNDEENRSLIRGVIGAGNTNFGEAYCLAGDIISAKCRVPHLYKFEVFGTEDDVRVVNEGLDSLWHQR